MTTFKQIIGRGTRLREKEGKLSFMVMDFRNITSLFADPQWDGPIEQVENFGEEISNNNNNGKEHCHNVFLHLLIFWLKS